MKKILLIVILILGVGIFLYIKNTTTPKVISSIPDYNLSNISPTNLTIVKLSHHSIDFESPWGTEKSFKGGDMLGQYVFANGVRMTVNLNKINPKEELKNVDLSPNERKEFDSFFTFVESKIGPNYTSYDYLRFMWGTSQQTVSSAITNEDKLGYSKVLELKAVLPNSPIVPYQFNNQKGKGFVYFSKDSEVPSVVDFFDYRGWRFSFMFPSNQNISKGDMDVVIKTIRSI